MKSSKHVEAWSVYSNTTLPVEETHCKDQDDWIGDRQTSLSSKDTKRPRAVPSDLGLNNVHGIQDFATDAGIFTPLNVDSHRFCRIPFMRELNSARNVNERIVGCERNADTDYVNMYVNLVGKLWAIQLRMV